VDADRHDAGLDIQAPTSTDKAVKRATVALPLVGATDQPTMQVRQVPPPPVPAEGSPAAESPADGSLADAAAAEPTPEALAALAPLLAPPIPTLSPDEAAEPAPDGGPAAAADPPAEAPDWPAASLDPQTDPAVVSPATSPSTFAAFSPATPFSSAPEFSPSGMTDSGVGVPGGTDVAAFDPDRRDFAALDRPDFTDVDTHDRDPDVSAPIDSELVDFEPDDVARPARPAMSSGFFGEHDPGERLNLAGGEDDDAIEPDETIDADDELPAHLRIGGWVPDVDGAPAAVPLGDAITQLLPYVPAPAGTDLEALPADPPALNLPGKRAKAWLLPGGRSQVTNSQEWEPQHKHPRTVRLRYAAGILAIGGLAGAVLYSTVGFGGSAAPVADPPVPVESSASPSDAAGGVIVSAGATSPADTASATSAAAPSDAGTATPTPSGGTLGLGGSGKSSVPDIAPWFTEAESSNNVMTGPRVGIIDNSLASNGQEVYGVGGSNTLQVRHVPVPAAGRYTLTIWYSSSYDRHAFVSINNGKTIRVNFRDAGGFDDIGVVTVTVSLAAGDNTLLWTADRTYDAPAFDRFRVDN
jgi:nicotinate-nucleotide--dimethylbenzimidazole phosphoribosyltransferase